MIDLKDVETFRDLSSFFFKKKFQAESFLRAARRKKLKGFVDTVVGGLKTTNYAVCFDAKQARAYDQLSALAYRYQK